MDAPSPDLEILALEAHQLSDLQEVLILTAFVELHRRQNGILEESPVREVVEIFVDGSLDGLRRIHQDRLARALHGHRYHGPVSEPGLSREERVDAPVPCLVVGHNPVLPAR